jgi:NAD(P)H-hydrate epimerase
MAKAGSGDVLTGIITGLLTRGYSSEIAARLGVYLHGYAGDLAVSQQGFESALASDITANLPPAFAALSK